MARDGGASRRGLRSSSARGLRSSRLGSRTGFDLDQPVVGPTPGCVDVAVSADAAVVVDDSAGGHPWQVRQGVDRPVDKPLLASGETPAEPLSGVEGVDARSLAADRYAGMSMDRETRAGDGGSWRRRRP